MPQISPSLHRLLKQALISLPAWHLLEGLARNQNKQVELSRLVAATGLDVTQAQQAATALCQRGILRRANTGELSLAPAHAEDLMEFCDHVEADRDLRTSVIKQAARGEFAPEPLEKRIRRASDVRVRPAH